ncbi:putative oxidoreductase,short chain dehydrogenase [Thozetella sp. PMI_491]|nr:putative oxidoreductase,short chain dehydrogenase [Thozetella sp. PMI_491]
MAEIFYSQASAEKLRGRVVVLTGGGQGIGAALVGLLHGLGAHVFFGDWDKGKGQHVERTMGLQKSPNGGSVHFVPLDVRDYQSQLALFEGAYQKHGRVDVAISCAAVTEPGGWFEPEDLNLKTVRTEPLKLKENIDINLTSVLSFSRIALAYMKESKSAEPVAFSKSIILVSSIAGITEAPGLFAYSSGKHGVIGLMRALRPWAPVKYGVRANAICPWATDTQLLAGVRERWVQEKMPMNQPADVARIIIQCAADASLNGKAVFVSGGRGFDTEEGVERTQPQWMGKENSAIFQRGQEILGLGDNWTDHDITKSKL